MNPQDRRQLLSGIRVTSLGTLVSRVLGLLRDVSTAALLGLAVAAAMAPLMLGLARGPGDRATIGWPPGQVAYPLQQGAAAAIWYGERMYHFPVGILGLATATALFPRLSRHAARGDRAAIRRDMTLGLRLVLFLGIPAAVGLAILAEPIVALLFERGAFTHHGTLRTSRVIVAHAGGVWAYCALPVVVRGFYALGERGAPLRVAGRLPGRLSGLRLADESRRVGHRLGTAARTGIFSRGLVE